MAPSQGSQSLVDKLPPEFPVFTLFSFAHIPSYSLFSLNPKPVSIPTRSSVIWRLSQVFPDTFRDSMKEWDSGPDVQCSAALGDTYPVWALCSALWGCRPSELSHPVLSLTAVRRVLAVTKSLRSNILKTPVTSHHSGRACAVLLKKQHLRERSRAWRAKGWCFLQWPHILVLSTL